LRPLPEPGSSLFKPSFSTKPFLLICITAN
jgi:hypothetical protein